MIYSRPFSGPWKHSVQSGNSLKRRTSREKYLRTFSLKKSIKDDTWEKIYPFVKNYLPGGSPTEVKGMHLKGHLTTDQRILMDAFDELSKETREKKLIEIVELARVEVERKNSKFF